MKYTAQQLEDIAFHLNLYVEQDDDGNVVGNTSPVAETGWRPIFWEQCEEALAVTQQLQKPQKAE